MGIYTVNMPDIGEGVVEGEIITWLKQVGEAVAQDEPVVVLMTDKATVELPAPYPGKLAKQYYKVGETAIKDKPLYDIELERVVPQKKEASYPPSAPPSPPLKAEIQKKPEEKSVLGKVLASPPVRKLARDLGLDINLIKGSGPSGRVTREDISRFHAHISEAPQEPRAEAKSAALIASATTLQPLPGDRETPIIGIKRLMAQKMVESKSIIPHFSYLDQADATRLVAFRDKIKKEAEAKGIKLTFMPFFIKALSLCLKKHPLANSSVDLHKNTLVLHRVHNIGIAMSTPLGLIVPVLKNIQDATLFDTIYAYEAMKKKAKEGKLLPGDMKEATVTITNFGALAGGGVFATPIINYPEVAILGVARIQKQPVVINEETVIRSILNCSWSFDHRVIDGEEAAKISSDFIDLIENPAKLM